MHIFYTPDIASDFYTLSEEESKHLAVLRLSKGDIIQLIDGKGGFYEAEIVALNKRSADLKIISTIREYGKRNFRLHIAVSPTKNIERFEWFLEKATEIGIDQITPLICHRSERRQLKIERSNRIITSAVKQSVKAYHPRLNEPIALKDLLDGLSERNRFIAHCMDGEKEQLSKIQNKEEDCIILIGPEGDFTLEELELAQISGFKSISLGSSRLRTETAALYACLEINLLNR